MQVETPSLPISLERRVLVASAGACTVGFTTIFVQPVLLYELVTRGALSEAAAGVVLTAEMLAVALSSGLGTKLCTSGSLFTIGLAGTIVAALANGLSLLASGYAALLAARFLCGLGEGTALMVASAAPARLADPDRAYAKINAVSVVIGTLVVYLAPRVGRITGGPMAFPAMLACFVALTPAVLLMPRQERFTAPATSADAPRTGVSRSLIAICLSFFIVVTINSAIFALCAILGARAGLDPNAVNDAIAVAILFSLAGSVLAGVVGVRFGRPWPMTLGLLAITVALFCMCTIHTAVVFRSTAAVQMMGDYFILPYVLGSAAEKDRSGRGAALVNAAIPLSYAAGPFIGGMLSQYSGFGVLAWLAVVLNGIAFSMWYGATRSSSVGIEGSRPGAIPG